MSLPRLAMLALVVVLTAGACRHPGPVIGSSDMPSVGGTIAGIVTATEGTVALPGRKVTVVNTASGARFEATTGENGGYTIKVPEGNYRIDVELHSGESVSKHPDDTHISNGDLDAQRDFVITASR